MPKTRPAKAKDLSLPGSHTSRCDAGTDLQGKSSLESDLADAAWLESIAIPPYPTFSAHVLSGSQPRGSEVATGNIVDDVDASISLYRVSSSLCRPLSEEPHASMQFDSMKGSSLERQNALPIQSCSLHRSVKQGPWRSRPVHAVEGLDASLRIRYLDDHVPTSDYGAPAYLEAPDRPLVTGKRLIHLRAFLKVVFSAALLLGLVFGYIYAIKVIDIRVTTVGLYGTILMADFVIQYCCALLNRWEMVRIVRRKKRSSSEKRQTPCPSKAQIARMPPNACRDIEKDYQAWQAPRASVMNPSAEVGVAVVGYREDERAWKECLRSLQKQTLKPKCIVGVVDGNDKADLYMAKVFKEEFAKYKTLVVHLPILLSKLHRETYFASLASYPDDRTKAIRLWHRINGHQTDAHRVALLEALSVVLQQIDRWEAEHRLSSYEALCFSQPHGHKRTAMFTAFAISLWAIKVKHAVFTTDSDTIVKDDALDEMLTILQSHSNVGGVTGDVKIWNRTATLLARLCAVRYWFAFNVERACQSWWRCVSCLSGPMSMYRSHDLHIVLGSWNLQTFMGKETTFGDDRHLTNQMLAQGYQTRYTHRTWCESESPTHFSRWVKQQTRWSKSFFREAFWFPHAFALHSWWLLVETTKQSLYPFILVATILHFLFDPATAFRPVIWLVTMFGIALVKSLMAILISADLSLLMFSLYGFVYFFGLLPSKFFAIMTMNKTSWGTTARSAAEMNKAGATFVVEFFHLGHLCFWYLCTAFGLAFFCSVIFDRPLLVLLGLVGFLPCFLLFFGVADLITLCRTARAKISERARAVLRH